MGNPHVGPLDELFSLDVTVHADRWVVTVRGELDCRTSARLGACLETLRDADAAVVVDLAPVRFIDSAGIGVLVDALRAAQRHEQRFSLRSPSPATQRVLDMTGVRQLVEASSA